MVGAIDVASHAIETPEEVAETLRKALAFVDADKLYPSTNCGMAPLPRHVATGKLHAPERRRRNRSPRAGGKVRRGAIPVIFLAVSLIAGSPPERAVARSASCCRQWAADRPQGHGTAQWKQRQQEPGINRLRRGGERLVKQMTEQQIPANTAKPRGGERAVVGAQRRLLSEQRDQILG